MEPSKSLAAVVVVVASLVDSLDAIDPLLDSFALVVVEFVVESAVPVHNFVLA